MPDASTYPLYKAYVKNVEDFKIAEKEIRRTINRALKTGKESTVQVQSKMYALLYSTFSEAIFMKMILTPYGFEQTEIDQILIQESVSEKWIKCLELAFRKFTSTKKGSEIPNKQLELKRIIDQYIVNPSIIRNKIAHGQLTIALNRKNTGLNTEITSIIGSLDVVNIQKWFTINLKLCEIIEDLTESPSKAHYTYYYAKYQSLEYYIKKTEDWSIESKLKTRSMRKKLVSSSRNCTQ